jgi:coronin-1B/1C/6
MDAAVKIWSIPKEGLKSNMEEPTVDCQGHDKKVVALKFNPLVENLLVTASDDKNFRFWDITSGKVSLNIEDCGVVPHCLHWNGEGSLLAATDKAKMLYIIDPRASEKHITQSTVCHDSLKGARVIWMHKTNRIFTCGSSKSAERQFKIWDARDITKPLAEESIDSGSGQLMPFWDEDTCLMFLAGRGDGNIRYYEFVDEEPYYFSVDAFKSNVPQKGMGMVPKVGVDTSVHEVVRILKLQSTDVIPISFCVPRKSSLFQSDIYPKTMSPKPNCSIEDWLNGKNATVEYISLNPKDGENKKEDIEFKSVQEVKPKTVLPKVVSTPKELATQNEELRKRVESLEQEVWDLKNKLKQYEGDKKEDVKEEVKDTITESNE